MKYLSEIHTSELAMVFGGVSNNSTDISLERHIELEDDTTVDIVATGNEQDGLTSFNFNFVW